MESDAWGLTPAPTDPPAQDVEMGITTSDDDGWERVVLPHTVTRTAFALTFATCAWNLLRLAVLKTGLHKRRR